jgi:hypothetical protein
VREGGRKDKEIALLVAKTRAQGFAQVSGDHIPGLSAIAVPILDPFGEAAAAIIVVGFADGFEDGAIEALQAAGKQASNALGCSGEARRLDNRFCAPSGGSSGDDRPRAEQCPAKRGRASSNE